MVSGGAVGVDAAAHAGALDAGGRTVVVLGCGHDVPYPRANTGLFARVRAAGGTLASEHPPSTPPRAAHFLPRNRLIAALSAAVVVVEAAEDSGSLSTARAAGSRGVGRVLVLPGAPWDPGAAGCNQLIRDGATLVRSLTDILEELGATVTGDSASASQAWSGLDPPARAVLTALIDGQLLSLGRLAAATDLPPAALDAALLDLELAGLVRRTTAGIQAIGLPPGRDASPARPVPSARAPEVAANRSSGGVKPEVAGDRAPDGVEPEVARDWSSDGVEPEVAGGRSPDGVEADGSPSGGTGERVPVPGCPPGSPGPRGPPPPSPSAEVLECGGSGGDDDRDD